MGAVYTSARLEARIEPRMTRITRIIPLCAGECWANDLLEHATEGISFVSIRAIRGSNPAQFAIRVKTSRNPRLSAVLIFDQSFQAQAAWAS